MKILIATGNRHKFEELIQILPSRLADATPVEYLSLQDFENLELPPETGSSLDANAEQKAVFAARETNLPALADDTGLEVDALSGAPGVYTARYAGEHAGAEDNNRKLLAELEGIAPQKRSARFRTIACLATPHGSIQTFEGKLEGFIATSCRGENGFGYDPLFLVGNTQKTLAELTDKQKNAISHRAQAFNKLAENLVLLKNKK